jgi:hypothetical protein
MTATAAAEAAHPSSAIKKTPQPKVTPQKAAIMKSEAHKRGTASKGSTVSKEKEDKFSAAMDALAKLDIDSVDTEVGGMEGVATVSPHEANAPKGDGSSEAELKPEDGGVKPQVKTVLSREAVVSETSPSMVGGDGVKTSRELSPSVAAIFEAASSEMLSRSPEKGGSMKPRAVGKEDSSTVLKNLLHIGTPPTTNPSPPGALTHPDQVQAPLGAIRSPNSAPFGLPPNPLLVQPHQPPVTSPQQLSPAVLKLMRPSVLTHPGYSPRPLPPMPRMVSPRATRECGLHITLCLFPLSVLDL